jgi:hypothetical protein
MKLTPKHFGIAALGVFVLLVVASTQVRLIYVDPHVRAEHDAKCMLSNLETAIGMYEIDTGDLPLTLPDLATARAVGNGRGPYVVRGTVFHDPWGHEIIYQPSSNGTFSLMSSGPDGISGTGDDIIQSTQPTSAGDSSTRAARVSEPPEK